MKRYLIKYKEEFEAMEVSIEAENKDKAEEEFWRRWPDDNVWFDSIEDLGPITAEKKVFSFI